MKQTEYVFLISGREFSSDFLTSWTNNVQMLERSGMPFQWSVYYSPVIIRTRNTLFEHGFSDGSVNGKLFGGQLKCKKVILLDDDMAWTPEHMITLLESPHDIVTGIYATEDGLTTALMNPERVPLEEVAQKTRPFEVESAGLGFMAINFEVLEKMEFPWFDAPLTDKGFIGEDTYFCNKARDLGYKTVADPRIKVGHVKQRILLVP